MTSQTNDGNNNNPKFQLRNFGNNELRMNANPQPHHLSLLFNMNANISIPQPSFALQNLETFQFPTSSSSSSSMVPHASMLYTQQNLPVHPYFHSTFNCTKHTNQHQTLIPFSSFCHCPSCTFSSSSFPGSSYLPPLPSSPTSSQRTFLNLPAKRLSSEVKDAEEEEEPLEYYRVEAPPSQPKKKLRSTSSSSSNGNSSTPSNSPASGESRLVIKFENFGDLGEITQTFGRSDMIIPGNEEEENVHDGQ